MYLGILRRFLWESFLLTLAGASFTLMIMTYERYRELYGVGANEY